MVATDPHYLLKLHETRGVAFVSEMYVRASLERKETRAGHYREDYPVRDDSQLAWLCLRKDADSKPEFFRVPVPLSDEEAAGIPAASSILPDTCPAPRTGIVSLHVSFFKTG